MCEHMWYLVKAFDSVKGVGRGVTVYATYTSRWVCSECGQPREIVYDEKVTSN